MGYNPLNGEYTPDGQAWKYSFNPSGNSSVKYRFKNNSYNGLNGGLNLGKLPHNLIYYLGSDNTCIRISKNQTIDPNNAFSNSTDIIPFANICSGEGNFISGTHDIVLYDSDSSINNLITPAQSYKKIRLDKNGPNYDFFSDDNKYFWIEVKFIADYIIPESFNQDLNQTSEVEHDNLELNSLLVHDTFTLEDYATLNKLEVEEYIKSNLIKSYRPTATNKYIDIDVDYNIEDNYDSTKLDYLRTLPILLKQYYQSRSSIYLGQIMTFLTNGRIDKEKGIITNAINTNIPTSEFTSWKDLQDNFILYHRVLALPKSGSDNNPVYNDLDIGSLYVKSAAIFQFNSYYKEWELGAAPEGQEILDGGIFDDLYDWQLANNPSSKLRFVLPFILRSNQLKANLTEGAIPFFSIKNALSGPPSQTVFDNYYKTRLDSFEFFKLEKEISDYTLHTCPIEIISQDIVKKDLRTILNQTYLELNQDIDEHNDTDEPYILVRVRGISAVGGSSIVQSFLQKIVNNQFRLRVFEEKPVGSEVDIPTSFNESIDIFYDLLKFSFAKNDNNKTLDIGNFLISPLTFKINLNSDIINIGISTENDSIITNYGRTTFNKQITLYSSFSPVSKWSDRIDLQTSNPPYGTGSNLENDRFSINTVGKIKSPTVSSIWKHIKLIVGGNYNEYDTSEGSGTWEIVESIPAENTEIYWRQSAITYSDVTNITQYLKDWINAIVGEDDINAYKNYVPITTSSDWLLSTNPLSLRELEKKILYERYNFYTLAKFIFDEKVQKGSTASIDLDPNIEGFGTLYQLHKNESAYVTDSLTHEGTGEPLERSKIYLSASGEWKYINETVRLPIK